MGDGPVVTLGVVGSVHRYPVKSMLGEELAQAEVTGRGVTGDRALALLDRESGRVASAKQPRLWQGLLGYTATRTGHGVRIESPDGKPLLSTDPGADEELSAGLGRAVTLIDAPPPGAQLLRAVPEEVLAHGSGAEVPVTVSELGRAAPPGTFFDFAPLHLLTTAALDRIARLSPRGAVEPARYRPNVVIDTGDAEGFTENGWVGRELLIGAELRLKVLVATPRCAVPTLAHGPLPGDRDALRVPARHNRVEPLPGMGPQPCAGVYARVLRPGVIRPGDRVRAD
ncbi:MOSC domain-containing protein [Kitasatospora sp. NPDC088346]|uniref:MOSC domain-containing protein n=1 Tax=Kitasatospora sp. NPDC088346 TaxID=3364073 RepID=UPI0038216B2C